MDPVIPVEVAFVTPEHQYLVRLDVPVGTTLLEAVALSGIGDRVPDFDVQSAKKGIYGELAEDDRVLEANDRVEIYRPLLVDPAEARRRRARGQGDSGVLDDTAESP